MPATQAPLLHKEGDPVGFKASNRNATAVLTMIPAGTTVYAAKTTVVAPNSFALIRLTGFPPAVNGYWNYNGNYTLRMVNNNCPCCNV